MWRGERRGGLIPSLLLFGLLLSLCLCVWDSVIVDSSTGSQATANSSTVGRMYKRKSNRAILRGLIGAFRSIIGVLIEIGLINVSGERSSFGAVHHPRTVAIYERPNHCG